MAELLSSYEASVNMSDDMDVTASSISPPAQHTSDTLSPTTASPIYIYREKTKVNFYEQITIEN